MGKALTQEEFVAKAKQAHGDRYDYRKAEYTKTTANVVIGCEVHGWFEQSPLAHLAGAGCQKCGTKSTAEHRSKRGRDRYLQHCEEKLLVPLEDYAGSQVSTLHWCIRHGQMHKARPNNITSGKGLRCCSVAAASERGRKRSEQCKAMYEERLKLAGAKVIPLEKYCGFRKPILHRCLNHGEVHLGVPADCLRGRGLKCCKTDQTTKINKRAKTYKQRLIEAGDRVEALETYKGYTELIKHRCKVHGEIHLGRPATLLKGHGLKCCNRGGTDVTRLRNDQEFADSDCYMYIAKINGMYLKPGISQDPEQRATRKNARDYYAGYAFVSPVLTRAEAWAIEQVLLTQSREAKPTSLPSKYLEMEGYTELRLKATLPAHWYVEKFHELVEELAEIGWEDLYLKYQTQTLT